jgi:glycosyltransferase involved in cell wall biosynthesis
MNKVILSHPTANANVRALAKGLLDADTLKQFYTTVALFQDSFLNRIENINLLREFKRRSFDIKLQPFTKTFPLLELLRQVSSRTTLLKKLTEYETGIFSIDSVYHNLDQKVAKQFENQIRQGANSIYAYQDGALASFKKAKSFNMSCLFEQPIGYWRTMINLLNEEKEIHPEWVSTLNIHKDSTAKLNRKDEELILADHIFAASTFTAQTLKDFPGQLAPVSIVPYGFPDVSATRIYKPFINRPLELLFVGGLSQRKGLANIFEAVTKLGKKVKLTIVGKKVTEECSILNKELSKHTWIPSLPHDKVLQLMRNCDVLLFPSLFEGFGLVITEAMSQGTPVITTERTAGPDLIMDSENGWIIKAGSTEELVNAIENLLLKPETLADVGSAAMKTASLRPWSVYGQEMARAIMTEVFNE